MPSSSTDSKANVPQLEEVSLPEIVYSPEVEEFLDTMVYRFPNCAGCPPKY